MAETAKEPTIAWLKVEGNCTNGCSLDAILDAVFSYL